MTRPKTPSPNHGNSSAARFGFQKGDLFLQLVLPVPVIIAIAKGKHALIRDQARRQKFCLLGASFGTDNLGVHALAEGSVRALLHRSPDGEIFFLDYAREPAAYQLSLADRVITIPLVNMRFSKKLYLPNNIVVLLTIAMVLKLIPFRWLRQKVIASNACLRQIEQADLCASIAGGDSFSDIYGLGRLLYVALPQILVLLLGKPLLLLPQTYGPFSSRLARRIARFIMARAQVLYSRDRAGIQEVRKLLGGNDQAGRLRFCHDVGFLVEPKAPSQMDLVGLSPGKTTGSALVGLNVSGLLAHGGYTGDNMFGLRGDYLDLIRHLIRFLIVEKETRVLLIPHVFSGPESVEGDAAVCEQLYESLKGSYPGRLGILRGRFNQNESKFAISQCDFFIGSRMHACIAALSQNVPAVTLAYSDKFIGVLAAIGVHSLVVDLRRLARDELLRRVEQALEARAEIQRILQERIPQVKASILESFSEIDLCTGNGSKAGSE